eukprot:Hpha_TRINITY_DN20290_c0_g1::TRINITY_DN20290_c0_g1_i1::g.168343::m.168343
MAAAHTDPEGGEVSRLLAAYGLGSYAELFRENGFDDVVDLIELGDTDLQELGISKMGHRRKLLRVFELVNQKGVGEALADASSGSLAPPGIMLARQTSTGSAVGRSSSSPASPKIQVRTQPRSRHHGDSHIVLELLAAKLEGEGAKDGKPYVQMSVCRTSAGGGVPMEHTVKRSENAESATNPAWGETHEFPLHISDGYYLVCEVRYKQAGPLGAKAQRFGLVAIPMRFFAGFDDDTLRDQWFPIKSPHSSQPQTCGEIHLRLRVPGGAPSQVGKAFKVTGVRMDTRKLLVHVVAGRVPLSAKTGAPRTTYVKLVVPNRLGVFGETQRQRRTSMPQWDEMFEFYAEVKNTPYLLLKLKVAKTVGNKTLGLTKIPLLFYLSLKDAAVLDQWFPVRDPRTHTVVGHVRLRLDVCQREKDELGATTYGQVNAVRRKAPPGPPSPRQVAVCPSPATPPPAHPPELSPPGSVGPASPPPPPTSGDGADEEDEEDDEEDSEAALFDTAAHDAEWEQFSPAEKGCPSCGGVLAALSAEALKVRKRRECKGEGCGAKVDNGEFNDAGWGSCRTCGKDLCPKCLPASVVRSGGCVMWPPPDGRMP